MLEYLTFSIGGFTDGYRVLRVRRENEMLLYQVNQWPYSKEMSWNSVKVKFAQQWFNDLSDVHLEKWESEYQNQDVLDGEQWDLEYKMLGKSRRKITGSNEYPYNWKEFLMLVNQLICRLA